MRTKVPIEKWPERLKRKKAEMDAAGIGDDEMAAEEIDSNFSTGNEDEPSSGKQRRKGKRRAPKKKS